MLAIERTLRPEDSAYHNHHRAVRTDFEEINSQRFVVRDWFLDRDGVLLISFIGTFQLRLQSGALDSQSFHMHNYTEEHLPYNHDLIYKHVLCYKQKPWVSFSFLLFNKISFSVDSAVIMGNDLVWCNKMCNVHILRPGDYPFRYLTSGQKVFHMCIIMHVGANCRIIKI